MIFTMASVIVGLALMKPILAQASDASLTLEISNQLDILSGSPKTDETFTFILENSDKDATSKISDKVSLKGAGKAKFKPLTFSQVGEHHYQVSQVKGNNSDYHYDQSIYEVTVYALYNEQTGQIEAKAVSNKLGETKKSELIFKQEYSVKTPKPHQPDTTEKEKPQKKRNGILPSTGEIVSYVSALGIVLVATITLYSIYKKLKTSK